MKRIDECTNMTVLVALLVVGILLALLGAWVTWLMGSKEQN